MGAAAREFVDFLAAAGQTYWQILPLCPTGFGDSPYQSFSTFAGNPYLIDLNDLAAEGLLESKEYEAHSWGNDPQSIDYGLLYITRYPVLRLACRRFLQKANAEYAAFCSENAFWLEDYAFFMAIKECFHGVPWQQWEPSLRMREPVALSNARTQLSENIEFWKVLQFLFFRQWRHLKHYANEKGVYIIGDLPIYVSGDSVDVWANPHLFQLDKNRLPNDVAGCPPDGFSADGQLWGNPLFDWAGMEADGFSWWVRRIEYQCRIYDVLRIDHFRGFDSYYAIPYGDDSAKNGVWRQGPGMKLFQAIERAIGAQNIIAEDLGFLTDSVRQLLRDAGFPGMKVLQFAFDSRDGNSTEYLPHNYPQNCVVYTGTHDNDTILGWAETVPLSDLANAKEYFFIKDSDDFGWGMIRGAWRSAGDLVIVPVQDLLGLGSHARMNIPSTIGMNWKWRALSGVFTADLAEKLLYEMKQCNRLPHRR